MRIVAEWLSGKLPISLLVEFMLQLGALVLVWVVCPPTGFILPCVN